MATLMIYNIYLLVSISFLVGVDADSSVKEFEALKRSLFGKRYKSLHEISVEKKINKMVKLIEAGDIPAEVQGEQTLEYFKSLTDNCKESECNLDEDLERLKFLNSRRTEAPNLKNYLQLCLDRIKSRCELEIYKRASAKLSPVDEESMRAIEMLARELFNEGGYRRIGENDHFTVNINHATVLKALKKLDPVGSKVMLKKWTNKKATLAKLMDKIRLPCVQFMNYIDPMVKLIPPDYHHSKVSNLHLYYIICKKLLYDWDSIFRSARLSYNSYLANPKSERRCFLPG